MSNTLGLYRYDTIIGIWKLARMCDADTADQWLAVWQRDEPQAQFTLAKHRPVTTAERTLRKASR